ncbi:methyl-accepting chemotaxis protein [Catenovulum sediminis]|uniref:Methyl-accepting chemotaxis protein n=1 Tax=Catenovulum sediminis TaxID=1740262 RepID=A0ABV1REZ1_9ALTE
MIQLGFRRTLVLVVSILVLASLLITVLVSDRFFRTNTSADLKRTILNSATYESIRIADHVQKSAKNAIGVAKLYEQFQDKVRLDDLLKIAAISASVHKVTIGFADGRSYASKHDANFPGGVGDIKRYDPRTRSWFKFGRSLTGLGLSDVFFTTKSQEPMLGALHPIENGVVLVDVRLTHIKTLLEEMKVVDGAVGVLVDGKGTVLESTADFIPVRENINTINVTQPLAPTILANEDSFNLIDVQGEDYVLVSKKILLGAGVSWNLLVAVDSETAFAQVKSAVWKLRLLALVIGLVSILVLVIVLAKLYRPVLDLKTTVAQLAEGEGDLTSRLKVRSNDDLGDIARGINRVIGNLHSMISEVKSVSIQLSNGVNVLREHEKQTSDILKNHSKETEFVVTAVEQLSYTAQQVSEHADNTVKHTREADTLADTSKNNIQSAQDNLQNLVREVEQTTNNITAMNNETQDIASILGVIGGIAEQTNLLALNAAIEAARAGEQGRGFAVVADEVRALASKTQHSTKEIEEALQALKDRASSVVVAIERTGDASQYAVSEAQLVAENLSDLINFVSLINELNVQISSSAGEQNTVISEINKNMTHIHQMVDELNEKGDRMRNETASIETLNTKLVSLVSKFKLS